MTIYVCIGMHPDERRKDEACVPVSCSRGKVTVSGVSSSYEYMLPFSGVCISLMEVGISGQFLQEIAKEKLQEVQE